MQKLPTTLDHLSEKSLIWLISAVSVLLAFWAIYIQQGKINDDAVLYLEIARLFSIGDLKQGLALYNWPLYPALIAIINKMIGLDFQSAAHLLSIVLFALATFSFVALIKLAGGNKTTIASGALLLFSSTYVVGDILPMLVRDQGFWAFFLSSLVFFIQFYRDGKLPSALLWQVCAIIAVLFRVEAITYLALLPLIILGNQSITYQEKAMRLIKANLISLLAVIVLISTLLIVPSIQLDDLGRLKETYSVLQNNHLQITQGLAEKAKLIHELILHEFAAGYAMLGLILTLISIIMIKTATTAGWVTVALLAVTGTKNNQDPMDQDAQRILIYAGALALLNMCMILLQNFLLSGRYAIALAFVIMIFASFALARLLEARHDKSKVHRYQRWLLIAAITLLGLGLLQNLVPKSDGYNYEQEAGTWIKHNTSEDHSVFYVSPRARYYAGAPYAGRGYDYWELVTKAIADGSIHRYDYLVINIDSKHPEREKLLAEILVDHQLVQEFAKLKSKEKILIFAKK